MEEKARYDLLPPCALQEVAEVLTFGAKKHAPDGWRSNPSWRWEYVAKTMRHLWAWKRGERVDPESGKHHLAHAACDMLFLLEHDLLAGP